MITETHHEFCVIIEYPDGKKFCMAKFMHEEDAREYLGTREKKDYIKWKLYKRYGSMEEARWEALEG